MVTKENKMKAVDVVTPEFRASYLNVFEARQASPKDPNSKKQFGVEMWFRIADTKESLAAGEKIVDIKAIVAAAKAAAAEKWGADEKAWPKKLKLPFKKGEDSEGKQGAIPGVMIVRTSRPEAFGRPVVVDQNLADIIDKNQLYSGCYMRGKMHAYAWTHPTGGNGVSFTLDMLQLVRDGEPLGGKNDPADAFEPIAVPASAGVGAVGKPAAAAPAAADVSGAFGDLG